MPVKRHPDITGAGLVFVTTTVTNWTPVFALRDAALATVLQLGETAAYFDVAVVGYVVMPTHFHGLLGFKELADLSEFMRSFKRLTAGRIRELDLGKFIPVLTSEGKFHLWKRRFDDLIVYSEKQFRTKLEYIHTNPVRAELTHHPEEWEFSSACDWSDAGNGLIPITKDYTWLLP